MFKLSSIIMDVTEGVAGRVFVCVCLFFKTQSGFHCVPLAVLELVL